MADIGRSVVAAWLTAVAKRKPATPNPSEWHPRLCAVLAVVYLIFTEGYAATSGPELVRFDLAHGALRLGRMLSSVLPKEPEVLGLLALMEFQASRHGEGHSLG